jgi:tyrosyl-tRNA synthetase
LAGGLYLNNTRIVDVHYKLEAKDFLQSGKLCILRIGKKTYKVIAVVEDD